jgi:hypothetical protein
VFDASTYIEGKCIEGYDKAQLSLIKFSNYQKKRNSTNVASCSLFFVPDTRGKTAAELHRLYDSGNDNHAFESDAKKAGGNNNNSNNNNNNNNNNMADPESR